MIRTWIGVGIGTRIVIDIELSLMIMIRGIDDGGGGRVRGEF